MTAQPLERCGSFTVERSGELTIEQLTALARPVEAELQRITSAVERRLVVVEAARVVVNGLERDLFALEHGRPAGTPQQIAALKQRLARATTALERLATPFQADADARLAPLRPTIDRIVREAQADYAGANTGPDRDLDRWLGPSGPVRRFHEAFQGDCVNTNHLASFLAHEEEARVSVTTYQRVRKAYERLRPNVPAAQRLPREPIWGDD